MTMDDQVKSALERVSKLMIAEVGDACKDDLILLGTASGFTLSELLVNFPDFFARREDFDEDDSIEREDENDEDQEVDPDQTPE